jgi:hypothetical protein
MKRAKRNSNIIKLIKMRQTIKLIKNREEINIQQAKLAIEYFKVPNYIKIRNYFNHVGKKVTEFNDKTVIYQGGVGIHGSYQFWTGVYKELIIAIANQTK